jgi:transcriptional regulator with XRE-family HTH domain
MMRSEQIAVAVKILPPSIVHREAQITLHLGNVPPRSRLYGLGPCEVGTIRGECLTSYLNRLGRRHGVSPRDLVTQELLPYLNKRISRQQLSVFSWSSAMSINGNGNLACEWATALEKLTTRPDLHLLTLSSWVGDLQARRFLREKPAWCPACYAEWKEQEQPLYEALVWMLQTVTLCIKHKRKLEDHCPHCQKRQSFIKADTLPGHCTQCNAWLGGAFSSEVRQENNEDALEWQEWVMYSLEGLHSTSMSSGRLSWEQFFTNLATSFDARGEQSRLAELAGMARGQFARWLRGSSTPSLESILEFCYICDVTPLQIMTGNLVSLKCTIQSGKPYRPPRSRRLYRPVDRERCLARIQAVLDGREEPLGYVPLAQQLGYSGSALLYHFPQECASLTKRVQEYRRQRKEQRLARVQNEIRQATLTIHAQGVYPSQNKVADLLSDPNVLFQPEAKATWRALCRELGWDRGNSPAL